jgi:hypothetical protein
MNIPNLFPVGDCCDVNDQQVTCRQQAMPTRIQTHAGKQMLSTTRFMVVGILVVVGFLPLSVSGFQPPPRPAAFSYETTSVGRRPSASAQAQRHLASVSTTDESASTEAPPPFRRPDVITAVSEALSQQLLENMQQESAALGRQYAEQFGLDDSATCAGLYALLRAMKQTLSLGLQGYPLVLRKAALEQVLMPPENSVLFQNFFTMAYLEKAVEDDFLDAARGSTDNRKGWKVR